ncbi:MAG TPA: aldo/keto reductase [Pyrinomonadaceae bacterium]|nr:aldo/keto reductase [Pyrinomonadaceae bacterium]
MEKRKLGTSDLEITPVGFGAWAIGGGDYAFGWGDQDDVESIATIEHAIASGINWIDTAAVYGLGRSEEVVGRALKNLGSANRPYVFTKCSLVWNEDREISHSLEPASIRSEVEASLKRLDIDSIDLYQIHWPRLTPADSDEGIESGWQTLVELKREGKVRNIGVSNFDALQLERISKIEKPVSLQPPYSALRRDIESETLPYCEANNIGTIVYSPMQAGLLSGKMTKERVAAFPANDWRTRNPYFAEPALTKNLAIADKFKEIGERHGLTAGAAAIAWTLRLSAVTGAIVGARRPDQIDGIISAGAFRLSDDEISEIQIALTGDLVSDTAA